MDLQVFVADLKDYIACQKPSLQCDESLLEILFNVYTEFNGFDNDSIREDFNALYAAMNGKSLHEMDEILYSVCTLCRDHQRLHYRKE